MIIESIFVDINTIDVLDLVKEEFNGFKILKNYTTIFFNKNLILLQCILTNNFRQTVYPE